jgi:hypothetical protein
MWAVRLKTVSKNAGFLRYSIIKGVLLPVDLASQGGTAFSRHKILHNA